MSGMQEEKEEMLPPQGSGSAHSETQSLKKYHTKETATYRTKTRYPSTPAYYPTVHSARTRRTGEEVHQVVGGILQGAEPLLAESAHTNALSRNSATSGKVWMEEGWTESLEP